MLKRTLLLKLLEQNKGKLLAVDFGEKHVGLAVSDETQTFVFGRGVIEGFGSLEALFQRISVMCEEEGVVTVIFGLPGGREGEETEQTDRYRGIGRQLEAFLQDIPVVFEDESFSSFEADTALDDPELRKKYNQHELAAMVILERYLKR